MRSTVVGAMVSGCLALMAGFVLAQAGASAARSAPAGGGDSSRLMAFTATLGDGRQQLTVIDPEIRAVSVYHIDAASGAIALKSVRNIHWDLQVPDYNGAVPLPREIRAQLEQR